MKLYNSNLSPYTSRVRIAIYAKNLPVEIVSPPGGTGTPEYKRLNPTGKVPALEVDGQVIAESEVINEYLEDRFPTPSLGRIRWRGRACTLSRFGDLYLSPPLGVLFDRPTRPSATRSSSAKLAELGTRLDQPEREVTGPYAAGAPLADCALAPLFFFLGRLMAAVGRPGPLEDAKLKRISDTIAASLEGVGDGGHDSHREG
jgi:glutathione S-transferase